MAAFHGHIHYQLGYYSAFNIGTDVHHFLSGGGSYLSHLQLHIHPQFDAYYVKALRRSSKSSPLQSTNVNDGTNIASSGFGMGGSKYFVKYGQILFINTCATELLIARVQSVLRFFVYTLNSVFIFIDTAANFLPQ